MGRAHEPLLVAGTRAFAGAGDVCAVAFGADKRLWVLRSGEPCTLSSYDEEGELLAVRDLSGASALAVRGDEIALAEGSMCRGRDAGETIRALAFGPDARLAVLTTHRLQIWDGDHTLVDVHAHDKDAWCLAWQGDILATGGYDHHARLWAPDGHLLAEVETNNVRAVCLADGLLYTGGGSGKVCAWRIPDLTPAGPVLLHEFEHGGHPGIQAICVRDGTVYTWANDDTVRAWRDGAIVWQTKVGGHGLTASPMALGRDRLALTTMGRLPCAPLGLLSLDGGVIAPRSERERLAAVTALLGGMGKRLVDTHPRGMALISNAHVERHEPGFVGRISGYPMRSAAYGPNGDWIATAGDGTLAWWWLDPLQICAREVALPSWVYDVAVSPDGAWVAVTHSGGGLIYGTADGTLQATFDLPQAGGVHFIGLRTVLVAARSGIWRWSVGGALEEIVRFTHLTPRRANDEGWPLWMEGSCARYQGADGNVWEIEVDIEEVAKVAEVSPPHRPPPLVWNQSVWCFVGNFRQIEREKAVARIEALGSAVAASVTARVTHLCVGVGGYGKRKISAAEAKAKVSGVWVLTEADLLVACAPTAEEIVGWDGCMLTRWRQSRPPSGLHEPLEVPALRGIRWPGAQLSGADLQYADLRGANLDGADLSRIKGERMDLRGASLRGANLDEASFYHAIFEGADITGASVQGTTFYGAMLEGVIGRP